MQYKLWSDFDSSIDVLVKSRKQHLVCSAAFWKTFYLWVIKLHIESQRAHQLLSRIFECEPQLKSICLCFLVLQQLRLHSFSNVVTSSKNRKEIGLLCTIKYPSRSVALFVFILWSPMWKYIFFPCFFLQTFKGRLFWAFYGKVSDLHFFFPVSVTVVLLAFLCVCDKAGAETETKLLILEKYSLCAGLTEIPYVQRCPVFACSYAYLRHMSLQLLLWQKDSDCFPENAQLIPWYWMGTAFIAINRILLQFV